MRAALLVLSLLLTLTASAAPVCKVYDGDTFTLCNGQRIRVDGIDSPELKQPYGYQARDYARALILNRNVTLACNGWSNDRRVCGVTINGRDFATLMVQAGFAFDSPRYSRWKYAASEKQARSNGVGVWRQPRGGQRPWDYRKQQRAKR